MEMIVERPGALDVHKAQVTACVRTPAAGGGREPHLAEFPTTVAGLLALRDWLAAHGVTQVVMEATGVYWKPVWAILEDDFELMLVNARHVKQVPGRKTDMSDAAWLCQLAEAGLLRASFVPPKPIRDAAQADPLSQDADPGAPARGQPAAQGAGGHRHQARLRRLGHPRRVRARDARRARGGHDRPEVLAELAKGRLRQKIPALREALEGRFDRLHALLDRRDPRAPGLPRRADRAALGGDRGADRPFRAGR